MLESIKDLRDEIKKDAFDKFTKGTVVGLKAMPLWMEALGAGLFMTLLTETKPRFKRKLAVLDGKVFKFDAIDLGKTFSIHVIGQDIKLVPHCNKTPDVTMRGEVGVLMSLMTGKEDPDTVFFSRKLEITGDTAAAIHFKNSLADL